MSEGGFFSAEAGLDMHRIFELNQDPLCVDQRRSSLFEYNASELSSIPIPCICAAQMAPHLTPTELDMITALSAKKQWLGVLYPIFYTKAVKAVRKPCESTLFFTRKPRKPGFFF